MAIQSGESAFANLGGLMKPARAQLPCSTTLGILEINAHSNKNGFCVGPIQRGPEITEPVDGNTVDDINALYHGNAGHVWSRLKELPWDASPNHNGIILLTGCNSGLLSPSNPESFPQALADVSGRTVVATGGFSSGTFTGGDMKTSRFSERFDVSVPRGQESLMRPSEDGRMWIFYPRVK
jgi:hypothetical protein